MIRGQERSVWNRGFAIAAILEFAAIAGCAATVPATPEKVVEQKAAARWNAIVAADYRKAYDFISPAGRATITAEGYESGFRKGFHKGAQVKEVRCTSPELCEVTVDVEYEFAGRRTKTPLTEKWVRQDSDWWYLYQR